MNPLGLSALLGGLWAVSRVGGWCVRFLHLPGFILLGHFSGALLVVSILDGVFDCISSSFESYVLFLVWGWPFESYGGT